MHSSVCLCVLCGEMFLRRAEPSFGIVVAKRRARRPQAVSVIGTPKRGKSVSTSR